MLIITTKGSNSSIWYIRNSGTLPELSDCGARAINPYAALL